MFEKEKMNEYEYSLLMGALRYYIGRQSITAVTMALDIAHNSYGRFYNEEIQSFVAYEINRCIADQLRYSRPRFNVDTLSFEAWSPSMPTAFDCFCLFIEKYEIKTKAELIMYKEVNVKFDKDTGEPLFETKMYEDGDGDIPNLEYYYLTDINALVDWNHVVHLFDTRRHKKVKTTFGEELECFETWKETSSYSPDVEYKKVLMDVNKINWNCTINPDCVIC